MSNSYTDTNQNDAENSIMGEVITITYRSDDTGWTVFKILPDDSKKTITATGSVSEIHEGQYLKLTGDYVNHPSFGKQFKFSFSQISAPTSKSAIIRYLSSGVIKGIGKKNSFKDC